MNKALKSEVEHYKSELVDAPMPGAVTPGGLNLEPHTASSTGDVSRTKLIVMAIIMVAILLPALWIVLTSKY
jgi:hypothetical protein